MLYCILRLSAFCTQWRYCTNRGCLTALTAVHTRHFTCSTCPARTPPLRHIIPLPLPASSTAHCSSATWLQSAWAVQTGLLCSVRETGPIGAESWWVALVACQKAFSPCSHSPSWNTRNRRAGLGWLSTLHPEVGSCRHCSEVQSCQHWMDTTWEQRRPTTLSLRVSASSLIIHSMAANQILIFLNNLFLKSCP